ncbi:hypothetical protein [Streptomyces sp. NPDC093707]|uniref:hypothetical protein n=1 Tax=Streptomyces sp. NPDC093707 TaxID=3154984 RepID=UPI0034504017
MAGTSTPRRADRRRSHGRSPSRRERRGAAAVLVRAGQLFTLVLVSLLIIGIVFSVLGGVALLLYSATK